MRTSRVQRRSRSRRNSRFIFKPWMAYTGAAVLLMAGLLCIPGVRSAAAAGGKVVEKQVKQDFGTPDPDRRVLVLRLLDHSGSSRGAKEQILTQMAQVLQIPAEPAQTYIWRYSRREELVYAGLSVDRFVSPALDAYYRCVPPPTTRGTYLGLALEKVDQTIDSWRRDHPKGVVVLSIGTDGGIEDRNRTRKVAARLAGKNVYCLVHGVLVEQRLREQVYDALRPLQNQGHLFVCNEKDFAQVVERFGAATRDAMKAVKKS